MFDEQLFYFGPNIVLEQMINEGKANNHEALSIHWYRSASGGIVYYQHKTKESEVNYFVHCC